MVGNIVLLGQKSIDRQESEFDRILLQTFKNREKGREREREKGCVEEMTKKIGKRTKQQKEEKKVWK